MGSDTLHMVTCCRRNGEPLRLRSFSLLWGRGLGKHRGERNPAMPFWAEPWVGTRRCLWVDTLEDRRSGEGGCPPWPSSPAAGPLALPGRASMEQVPDAALQTHAVTHRCWEVTLPSCGSVLGAGGGGRAQRSWQRQGLWLGQRGDRLLCPASRQGSHADPGGL